MTTTADDNFLFSGGTDSLIKVWDLKQFKQVYTIYSVYDIGDIFSLVWVPSKETLYFGTQNASVQWIQLYEKESYTTTNDPRGLPSLRFDKFFSSKGPGGKLAPQQSNVYESTKNQQDEGLMLIEIPPKNVLQYAHYGYVYSMLPVRLGDKEMLVTGGGDGTAKLWDLSSTVPRLSFTFQAEDEASVLSMACYESFLYCGLSNGLVMMFDLDTLQMLRVDKVSNTDISALAVKGDRVISVSGGTIHSRDAKQQASCQWDGHNGIILAAQMSNEHKKNYLKLITGGNDNSVALWDVGEIFESVYHSSDHRNSTSWVSLDNEDMMKALSQCVSYKTVSGSAINDCRRCATYLRTLLRHFGAEVQLFPVENGGNPVVYGLFKGKKTSEGRKARVLFYGHYDVITVSSADRWETDPFSLTALDGYMYGRGVSDNKGPVIAAVFAAAQLVQSSELENDIVFIIEGEEESGSVGFEQTMKKYKDQIGHIDWILLSNSTWLDDVTPCLNYGLRGIINASVEISSGKPDLHSGVHGGVFREPTIDMVNLLSKLTERGKVLVPGFYESVRPVADAEKKLYEAITAKPGFENERDNLMTKWRYPSLTIHRIGVSGPGNSTVIPATATANISLRIVPDQELEQIKSSLCTYMREMFDSLESQNQLVIKFSNEADHWIGDPESDAYQILRRAIKEEWNVEPLFIREGGSIPVVRFLEKTFDAKAAQLPAGQASDAAHLDNERLRVTNLFACRNVLHRVFKELPPKDA
uniref:ARAD1C42394p n=1 Tax=Blastobotrys adeninivorans TaxID=409370 RepID=A0A060T998_BLAAD